MYFQDILSFPNQILHALLTTAPHFPSFQPLTTTTGLSVSEFDHSRFLILSGITHYLSFLTALFSLSSRFTHAVACIRIPLPFRAE
jgi:hypothetical protein